MCSGVAAGGCHNRVLTLTCLPCSSNSLFLHGIAFMLHVLPCIASCGYRLALQAARPDGATCSWHVRWVDGAYRHGRSAAPAFAVFSEALQQQSVGDVV